MAPPQKRQMSLTAKKEPEKAPPSSPSNTSASNDDNSPEATPPPNKKRMILEDAPVPVAQEKQPDPVSKGLKMKILLQLKSVEIDFAKTILNCNQLMKEMERIQKHDGRLFVLSDEKPMDILISIQELAKAVKQVSNQMEQIQEIGVHKFIYPDGYFEELKEMNEMTDALIVMLKSANIQPIRKRIQLVLKNCPELFAKEEFRVESASIELFGFNWYLAAKVKEKGYLAVYLHAVPPNGYNVNYQIEVDWRLSIVNTLVDKNLIENDIGYVYTVNEKNQTGRGFQNMAKFEDLLDPAQTFLTPEGDLEIWADFTIKSATMSHLT